MILVILMVFFSSTIIASFGLVVHPYATVLSQRKLISYGIMMLPIVGSLLFFLPTSQYIPKSAGIIICLLLSLFCVLSLSISYRLSKRKKWHLVFLAASALLGSIFLSIPLILLMLQ